MGEVREIMIERDKGILRVKPVADGISLFFSFVNAFRWLNWVLAVVLLFFNATPRMPLAITISVYGGVFLYNAALTLRSDQIKRLLIKFPALILVDVLFCFILLVVYGWRSPFTVYSFSPVMLSGAMLNLYGVFLVAGISAAAYGASVAINGFTWAQIVKMDAVDGHLFQYFDFFLVAIFFGFPAYIAEKLGESNEKLTKAKSMIEAMTKAKERQRLAGDIHDNVAQSLLGLGLILDASQKQCTDEQLNEQLSLAKKASEKALDEIRVVIDDLYVENYGSRSFCDIARAIIKRIKEEHSMAVDFQVKGKEHELGPEIKKNLCLILKEATTNVIKHARAESMSINIEFSTEQVGLIVIDNGSGIKLGESHKGHGIKNIETRVKALKGSCKITSLKKSGTKVEVRVPIESVSLTLNAELVEAGKPDKPG
ncbi:MAG TPA: sensor histidine kinase [Actinobacteria bacterium]|nr:sensor histidine kinase [Actinomycetota bacterium]